MTLSGDLWSHVLLCVCVCVCVCVIQLVFVTKSLFCSSEGWDESSSPITLSFRDQSLQLETLTHTHTHTHARSASEPFCVHLSVSNWTMMCECVCDWPAITCAPQTRPTWPRVRFMWRETIREEKRGQKRWDWKRHEEMRPENCVTKQAETRWKQQDEKRRDKMRKTRENNKIRQVRNEKRKMTLRK